MIHRICQNLIFFAVLFVPIFSNSLSVDISPDPWYVIDIKFDPESVRNLKLIYKETKFGVYAEISNPNEEAIYILDSRGYPIAKLQDSIWYHQDIYGKGTWVPTKFGSDPKPAEHFRVNIDVLSTNFGITPQQVYKDDRPVNQVPPPMDYFKITIVQKDKKSEVTGTLTYKLNPTYDPKSSVRKGLAAQQMTEAWLNEGSELRTKSAIKELLFYLLSIIVAIFVGWLYLRTLRKIKMQQWQRRLLGSLWMIASLIYIPIHFRVLHYQISIPSNMLSSNIVNTSHDAFGLFILSGVILTILLPLMLVNKRLKSFFNLSTDSSPGTLWEQILVWMITLIYISPLQMNVYKIWVNRFPFY